MFSLSLSLPSTPQTVTTSDDDKADQSTAASWWQSHVAVTPAPELDSHFFSATHGLVQTHPSLSGGIVRPIPLSGNSIHTNSGSSSSGGSSNINSVGSLTSSRQSLGAGRLSNNKLNSGINTIVNPNPKSPFRHLDFATSATAELRRNPMLSAPDECARACREGEPPRICYYHFTLEYYTVLGA